MGKGLVAMEPLEVESSSSKCVFDVSYNRFLKRLFIVGLVTVHQVPELLCDILGMLNAVGELHLVFWSEQLGLASALAISFSR